MVVTCYKARAQRTFRVGALTRSAGMYPGAVTVTRTVIRLPSFDRLILNVDEERPLIRLLPANPAVGGLDANGAAGQPT